MDGRETQKMKIVNGDFRIRTTFGEGWVFGQGDNTYFVAFSTSKFNSENNPIPKYLKDRVEFLVGLGDKVLNLELKAEDVT